MPWWRRRDRLAPAQRLAALPVTGDLAADRMALADCAASGERLLAELPAKGVRTPVRVFRWWWPV